MLREFVNPSGRARAVAREEGLTLIEVLIAAFVLAVAVLALASTAVASLSSMRMSRERQQATTLASAAIEEARSLDYRALGHPQGEVSEADDSDYVRDADGTSYFAHDDVEEEELIFSSSGEVTPYLAVTADGRTTIRTFVTWYDDPETVSGRDAKRVTVIVTWEDPQAGPGEVRQSTVVAAANRGLPVPRFEITPDDQERHAVPGGQVCFTHLFRNSGATDAYDWQLLNHGGNPATYVDAYTMRANGWEAQAWFGVPQYKEDGSPDTSADNIWKDTTGNQRMNSPWRVPSGSAEVLTVCYESKNQSADNHSKPDLRFVVRSTFDPQISEITFNRIDMTQPSHRLYLHNDPDNLSDHERELGAPYPMNTVFPIQENDDGTIFDLLFDYDTDRDPDGFGGIYLPGDETGATDGSQHTGIWTYNGFGEGTTLNAGELDVWVRNGPVTLVDQEDDPPTMEVAFALDLLSGTGEVLESVGVQPSMLTWTTSDDWTRVTSSFVIVDDNDEPTTVTFDSGEEHLRLRVWCVTDAAIVDCHLAYDTASHPSSLLLQEPS